jgi:hypothetical protein
MKNPACYDKSQGEKKVKVRNGISKNAPNSGKAIRDKRLNDVDPAPLIRRRKIIEPI